MYNREYIDATVALAGALPGVFLLGSGSQEVHKEIDELSSSNGVIASLVKRRAALCSTLGLETAGTGTLGSIQAAYDELSAAAWAKKSSMPPALATMFVGFNNSKARTLKKVLEVAGKHATTDTDLVELTRQATSVFDTAAVEIAELKILIEPKPEEVHGFELLETAIVGNQDVALTALIEELENSDWVSQGRAYFEKALGRCPFCQQDAPHDLANQLREYFDLRFTEQISSLADFIAWHDVEAEKLRDNMQAVAQRSVPQLDESGFAAARASLDAVLAANSIELQRKQATPSAAVKLEPFAAELTAVNTTIEAANALIREHNARIRNREHERRRLIARCWQHFVRDTIGDAVAVFESKLPPLLKAKQSLEHEITETSNRLVAAEARLRELEREIRSSKPIIEEINTMLTSVGFESFRLGTSPDLPDGYSLIRAGGTPAAQSLSEGERTFITFLYFFHQLQGEPTEPNEPRDLVAVIDDPISSLDSDILFVVSALTKRLMADIRAGTSRVRQLVVLTHNVYFHKEVTYSRRGESQRRRYFVLRKRSGQHSELIIHTANPIKTAYRGLWEEVRAAKQNPPQSPVALQNVMRRILENYFKVMGEVPEDELIAGFSGSDQMVCRSLFSWLNEGSHAIIEELHYSPTDVSTENFLTIFEAIFDKAGHHAHYAMMMQGID